MRDHPFKDTKREKDFLKKFSHNALKRQKEYNLVKIGKNGFFGVFRDEKFPYFASTKLKSSVVWKIPFSFFANKLGNSQKKTIKKILDSKERVYRDYFLRNPKIKRKLNYQRNILKQLNRKSVN